MLIIGTESRDILVLESTGMAIKKKITGLKSVASFIQATGQFDVDYRIYVACRDGRVYLIKNGEVVPDFTYTIESKPMGMLIFDKQVVIAGMNNTLHSFYLKGKKNFQILMPSPILDICKLEVKRTAASSTGTGQCVIVCLANSELRLYNPKDKNLIHILKTDVTKIQQNYLTHLGSCQWRPVRYIWKRGRMHDS